jgi:hypothetical protein
MNSVKDTEKTGGMERQLLFQEDFHVNHSPSREKEEERKTTVTSGRNLSGLSPESGPIGLLAKMLLESPVWYSPAMRLKWKTVPLYSKKITCKQYSNRNTSSKPSATISRVSDIPSNRLLFRLVPSARRTGGTGYGLLPTVTAMIPSGVDMEKPDARRERVKAGKKNGNGFGVTLNELALKGLLPTPNATEATKYTKKLNPKSQMGMSLMALAFNNLLPTPTNSMVTYQDLVQAKYHSTKRPEYNQILSPTPVSSMDGIYADKNPESMRRTKSIATLAYEASGKTSQLNPQFVAEMMGFPPGWTLKPFLTENDPGALTEHSIDGEKNP